MADLLQITRELAAVLAESEYASSLSEIRVARRKKQAAVEAVISIGTRRFSYAFPDALPPDYAACLESMRKLLAAEAELYAAEDDG